MIYLEHTMVGSILDIGGGGEGIIGRLYQNQVIAIDHSQEELDEAPDGFQKILMDATNLTLECNSFDNVTFFFTLMYMTTEEQKEAIKEAFRVLKPGGKVFIWDCDIQSAFPEPFCIDLDILIENQKVHTTYGIIKKDVQSVTSITELCQKAGFELLLSESNFDGFYLCCKKSLDTLY